MTGGRCAACGAFTAMTIAGTRSPRFDDLRENTIAKRAAEVALAGGHSLTLLSVGNLDDAEHIARCVLAQAVPFAVPSVRVVSMCKCGGFNSARTTCACSPAAIMRWFGGSEFKLALAADIVVEVVEVGGRASAPSPVDLPAEPDEHSLSRVVTGRQNRGGVASAVCDGYALQLLRAATDRLGFSERRVAQIVDVARTIAALSGADRIEASHIAEAVQYRAVERMYREVKS